MENNGTTSKSSYLKIDTRKRLLFYFLLVIVFTLFFMALSSNYEAEWTSYLWQIIIVALPVVLYPTYQFWVYTTWQAEPQKLEKHTNF